MPNQSQADMCPLLDRLRPRPSTTCNLLHDPLMTPRPPPDLGSIGPLLRSVLRYRAVRSVLRYRAKLPHAKKTPKVLTLVSSVKLPLSKFCVVNSDDEDDIKFVARVELEAESVEGDGLGGRVASRGGVSARWKGKRKGKVTGASALKRGEREELVARH
jgi:hypothetical protein